MGMLSLFSQGSVFGLDIGYETLKLVEVKKNKTNIELVGSAEVPLTERILERDHFRNIAQTATLIKESCRKAKPHPIKAKKIVSALPESFVFSKTVQLPKMSQEEYKKSVPIEAAQILPIPVEDVYIDFQVLISHPEESLSDILVVASPKKLVDDYVEMTKAAGLELVALETKPIAVGRAISSSSPQSLDGTVTAEIGTEVSRLSIWDSNNIKLISTVNIGKNNIKESLEVDRSSSSETNQAEPLSSKDLNTISVISKISNEILNVIKYHKNRDFKPKPIKNILLCGSGAKIKGIEKIIFEETKIETTIIEPKTSGSDRLGTEFITSFGLSLRNEYE